MAEEENNQNQENTKHTIEVSDELYQAIQQLKQVLQQMTWKEVQSDEEVLGILVSGFIESVMSQQNQEWWDENQQSWQQWGSWIIT